MVYMALQTDQESAGLGISGLPCETAVETQGPNPRLQAFQVMPSSGTARCSHTYESGSTEAT